MLRINKAGKIGLSGPPVSFNYVLCLLVFFFSRPHGPRNIGGSGNKERLFV